MARMVLLVVAVVLGGMSAWLAAQQQGGAATQIAIDGDDIAGVVTSARGPGGRRLGDRGDHRHADEVAQDRRDRRSRPVPAARPADEGHVQHLGSRLWAGRFDAGPRHCRAARSR